MNSKEIFKTLSKSQESHLNILKENVFELSKYPSFGLLIEGLENILLEHDFIEKNICILERTKLYGTSLFGGLFENAKITSFDCSPDSAKERGTYNSFMVEDSKFIKFQNINNLNQDGNFELPRNEYDVIFIPNLVHHFKNQQLLFSECFKALKNNGELIVFEPTFREIHQSPHDYLRYTPYGIKQIYEENLFTNFECSEIGDAFEALNYIINIMKAKREDLDFLTWCDKLIQNISEFKNGKKDIVKKHARFPTAFLCKGYKNV